MGQQEIWKPIKGYESFYEVSNFGKVRTFNRVVQQKNRTIIYKARELSLNKSGKKYYYVDLVDDMGKRKRFYVHRLVAMMFVPNPSNKDFVDHKNTICTDNRATNLEWVTRKENNNNPLTIRKMKESANKKEKIDKILATKIKNKCKNAPKKVYQYTESGVFVKEYESIAEAQRQNGLTNRCIGQAIKRNTLSGGYKWSTTKLE